MKHLIYIFLFNMTVAYSQNKILLRNKSFEEPNSLWKDSWYDCGEYLFPGESPPDIHSDSNEFKLFYVVKMASDGDKFLGMVVRDNETHESIAQKLSLQIKKGKCYKLSMDISIGGSYLSKSRLTGKDINYTKPCVLRIWGSNQECRKDEMFIATKIIENKTWKRYDFKIISKDDFEYIFIEAYWKVPLFNPYCGHILIDNLSDLEEIDCTEKFNTNY